MATSGLSESFHFAQRGREGETEWGGEKNPTREEKGGESGRGGEVWKQTGLRGRKGKEGKERSGCGVGGAIDGVRLRCERSRPKAGEGDHVARWTRSALHSRGPAEYFSTAL